LKLYGSSDHSTTDFTIRVQKWTGDTPITTADYGQFDGTNYDNGLFSTSGFSTSGYNSITLTNFGLISKTGNTLICVRSSRDISSTAPTGNEHVLIKTYDAGSSYEPQLEVTYTSATNYVADLTQSISSTWQTQIQTTFNIEGSQAISSAWQSSIQASFKVDAIQSITSTWFTQIQTSFKTALEQSISSSWLTQIQSAFNIEASQSISSSWQATIQTLFNIALSQTIVSTWLADIIHAVGVPTEIIIHGSGGTLPVSVPPLSLIDQIVLTVSPYSPYLIITMICLLAIGASSKKTKPMKAVRKHFTRKKGKPPKIKKPKKTYD